MAERDLSDQLVKYLTDVHSIEEQALVQMRRAPKIAGDDEISEIFVQHLHETERQEERVRDGLTACGGEPSKLKDLAGRAGGVGMVMFARAQPDTPGKLVAHAYSYEHLEIAAYELLGGIAQRASSPEIDAMAREICAEERRMAGRLESVFDRAAEASLREVSPDDLAEQLTKYLADAHAIEEQAAAMLERAPEITGVPELARVYEEHLGETREHERRVRERLEDHGASPAGLKDAAMRLGALNWGAFFAANPDTPAKLAGFAFAFEHLEIAGYEELRRVASQAGDPETVRVAERNLAEERAAARKIAVQWEPAIDASLAQVAPA
ncbi:MAG TPA: DUF892 family protein [Solirubrobacterales bacterium]|nr:DUF892 family protein [Solirubrobacterales bacterium]